MKIFKGLDSINGVGPSVQNRCLTFCIFSLADVYIHQVHSKKLLYRDGLDFRIYGHLNSSLS